MVVLRLARKGKKKQAFYRVVVADSRRFVNSKFIEIVGWYNPKTKEIQLNNVSIEAWMAKGAQPSNTVAKLLKANGVKLPDWVKIAEKVSKPKKEPVDKPKAEEKPVEAEVAEDVPTEESPEAVEAEKPEAEEPKADEAEVVEEPAEEADPSTTAQDDTEVPEEAPAKTEEA